MTVDARRLAAVISPLRRALLTATRQSEGLPDIPDSQVEVMRVLLAREHSSPSDVASALGMGRSTVSNLLVLMERAGLVTRSSGSADKRAVQIVPSEKAITAFMTFDATSADVVADAVALTLSMAEAQILEDAIPVLEKLRQAIAVAPRNEERGMT